MHKRLYIKPIFLKSCCRNISCTFKIMLLIYAKGHTRPKNPQLLLNFQMTKKPKRKMFINCFCSGTLLIIKRELWNSIVYTAPRLICCRYLWLWFKKKVYWKFNFNNKINNCNLKFFVYELKEIKRIYMCKCFYVRPSVRPSCLSGAFKRIVMLKIMLK